MNNTMYNDIKLHLLVLAIALVESNNDPTLVGKAGERGPHQFKHDTWYETTDQPFMLMAHEREFSAWNAQRRITEIIIPALHRAKRQVSVHAIARCWNAGVRGALVLDRAHEYGDRVEAIYALLMAQTPERDFNAQ